MLPASSRSALIHLIYKGSGDPEDISNYRPIALLAAEYKRFARCMARRLLPLMESLIHPDQTYGMSRRSIEQNISVSRLTFFSGATSWGTQILNLRA
jgi:hypothetical protein